MGARGRLLTLAAASAATLACSLLPGSSTPTPVPPVAVASRTAAPSPQLSPLPSLAEPAATEPPAAAPVAPAEPVSIPIGPGGIIGVTPTPGGGGAAAIPTVQIPTVAVAPTSNATLFTIAQPTLAAVAGSAADQARATPTISGTGGGSGLPNLPSLPGGGSAPIATATAAPAIVQPTPFSLPTATRAIPAATASTNR